MSDSVTEDPIRQLSSTSTEIWSIANRRRRPTCASTAAIAVSSAPDRFHPRTAAAVVASSPAQAQHELLDREVAGIGGFLARVAAQLYAQRSIDGQAEPLPGVERVAAASAALDRSDRGSAKPDSRTNLSLGQTPSTPGGTQLPAKSSQLFEVELRRLAGQVWMLELGHARCMIIPRAWRGLSRSSTRPLAVLLPSTREALHEMRHQGRGTARPDPRFWRYRPTKRRMLMQRARTGLRIQLRPGRCRTRHFGAGS